MPVNFKIFAEHGFALAHFHGQVLLDEVVSSARDYAGDPTYQPEQNMMIDLTGYEGTVNDFVGLMQAIAHVSDHLRVGQTDRLVVYVAPTPKAQAIAQFVGNSVAAIPGYVVRIAEGHLEAFHILGISTAGHECNWSEAKA
jgi:hypothetical protein